MFSKNYNKIRVSMSVLFVFSTLILPMVPVSVAFADEERVAVEATEIETTMAGEIVDENILDCSPDNQTVYANQTASFSVTALVGIQDRFYIWSAPEGSPSEQSGQNLNNFQTVFTNPGDYTVTVYSMNFGNDPASCYVTVVPEIVPPSPPSEDPIIHSCLLPDSLGDTMVEPVVPGWENVSLQDIFNQNGINKNVISDQKQYQFWNTSGSATTTIKVEFVSRNADLNSVFGYYKDGNVSNFTPIFRSGPSAEFPSAPEFSVGQSATLDITSSSNIGFVIRSNESDTYATLNSLNEGGNDHAVVYELESNVYIIAFEDLPISSSDNDFNDIVVRLTVINCQNTPQNTPPTITLIGANPFETTVGTIFVDPGATATDLEDGDATTTANIVVSGTVNASTTGTYILTYSVTDSGGLSASTTRTVNVNPEVIPPVNPPANDGGGGGGGGGMGGHRHPVVAGEILGATNCSYLRDYLKIGWQNDPVEVLKLQSFLNVFEKENLSLTGVFNQQTFEAVERFQIKYKEDILIPWGDKVTTGFVYILTKKKVNEIYCNSLFPVTQSQQDEIDAFRSSTGNDLWSVGQSTGKSDQGVSLSGIGFEAVVSPVVSLKSASSSDTASVVRNVAISLFALPKKIFNQNRYIAILLALIAAVIIVNLLRGSGRKLDDEPISAAEEPTENESPVIILPGAPKEESKEKTSNILPDEEIIIENEEEDI